MNNYTTEGVPRRLLSVLLACLLVLVLLSVGALAAAGDHIAVTSPDSIKGVAGSILQVPLDEVFWDSEGHGLDYSFSSDQNLSEHTKIKDGIFYFSTDKAGEYEVALQAVCETDSAACTLIISIDAAADGLPIQYNYLETNQESVQVFVTISSDGIPLVGKDEDSTILCHVPVTVPYFDLGEYGLEGYYRYRTDANGSYTASAVIERPTALHLYLYLLERFALGYPEAECGTGRHNPLTDSFGSGTMIGTMFGGDAYEADGLPLDITGSATSMYMHNFWGHDENLMYYRNHAYPLMRAGWGSTADYILLSDGDTIDLAMFTDWGFYQNGSFCTFVDRDTSLNDGKKNEDYTDVNYRPATAFTAIAGESKTVSAVRFGTQSLSEGGTDSFEPISGNRYSAGLDIRVYDEKWNEVTNKRECVTNWNCMDGVCTMTFAQPGTYYLLGLDANAGINEDGTSNACIAPATAKIIVKEAETAPEYLLGDVNGDGTITAQDVQRLRNYLMNKAALTPEQLAASDTNGDGNVTAQDVQRLRNYMLGKIGALG